VTLEVLPNLFDRIKFRRVSGKWLCVEARIISTELGDMWSLVDAPIVPKENDRPTQVVQKLPEKLCNMNSLEVLFLKPHIQSHVLPSC
jgi:hypothetical protein